MSLLINESSLRTRSEVLHLFLLEPDSLNIARIQSNLKDLENVLKLAAALSLGPRYANDRASVLVLGPNPGGFRIRRLSYGSPFEVAVEFVQSMPALLQGAAAAATVFTSVATGRLIWKKGNLMQADANKRNAEADQLRATLTAPIDEKDLTFTLLPEEAKLILRGRAELSHDASSAVLDWLNEAQSIAAKNKRRGRDPLSQSGSKVKKTPNPALGQLESLIRLASKEDARLTIEND